MNPDINLAILERLTELHERVVGEFDLACQKTCAHCCTANVTMTTLEGLRILSHLEASGQTQWLEAIAQRSHPDRFAPGVSINQLADICARGGDPPEEHPDPGAGPCPVLVDDACPLYPVRPFGCRCMVSAKNCGQTGVADMDPFILTVNDVFLQHIEHIDAKGYTGNFADVMQFLADDRHRRDYAASRPGESPSGLVPNHPMFVLMIPPEHRRRIQPLLMQIRGIRV